MLNCKNKNKNAEELFSDLPEPSRSIAIRAWQHREICLEIEAKFGEGAAMEYHNEHHFDGTFQTKEQRGYHDKERN
jgi:hypothetical protein